MDSWPGPGWLDCDGEDAGDGSVRCSIPVVGAGMREIVVPAAAYEAPRRRLRVRIVRRSDPAGEQSFDCPSQEMEALSYIVECPGADGETKIRLDVLAGFLNERIEEPEQVAYRA